MSHFVHNAQQQQKVHSTLYNLPAGTEASARVAAFPRGAVSGVEPIDRRKENGCSMRLQRVNSSLGSKLDMKVRAAARRMASSLVLPALPFLSDNRAKRIRVIKGMMWGRCSVAIPPLVSSVSVVTFPYTRCSKSRENLLQRPQVHF
jgi:hypothetical protein